MLNRMVAGGFRIITGLMLVMFTLPLYAQPDQKRNWVDSRITYFDADGNSMIFTNSLPKGGYFVRQKEDKYHYFVFWTSILNPSDLPLEVRIEFPAVKYFNSNKSKLIITFPNVMMTYQKLQDYDYGLTNLQSIFNIDSSRNKQLHTVIMPKKEYLFYVPVFIYNTKWPVRSLFILKNQELFYKITAGSDSVLIPCGKVRFMKSK